MKIALPRFTAPGGVPVWALALARAFANAMTTLEARLNRTAAGEWIVVYAPTAADTAFPVYHSLGAVPKMFNWQMEQAGNCYATEADRSMWTTTLIMIRCNVSNARLLVRVEA